MSNLDDYLDKSVSTLIAPLSVEIADEMKERHRIYSYLLMAITAHYWNGNKYGRDSGYPLNPGTDSGGPYLDKDYIGHNIAGLAVNGCGDIIDFEFNHNVLYSSSVEHAESRLMRRIFSLNGASLDVQSVVKGDKVLRKSAAKSTVTSVQVRPSYSTTMPDVTVYTSLESCSQCSGIMALGTIKEVVFLQDDPGMYFIGNILRRLTEGTGLQAPLPIAAGIVGVPEYHELNDSYGAFVKQQESEKGDPFQIKDDMPNYSSSVTSFLCTKAAHEIFSRGTKQFVSMELTHENYRPEGSTRTLTNKKVLDSARTFYHFAISDGRRATPHRT